MKAKTIIKLAVLLVILYFFRPWLHPLFMYFYTNPIIIEAFVLWAGLSRLLFSGRKGGAFGDRAVRVKLSLPLMIFLIIFASAFSGLIVMLELPKTLEYNKIETLSESSDNLRLMPMSVAYRYAKDSLQLAQYKLGPENIVNSDGSLSWTFPLVPDGGLLTYLIKNKGIVVVDATVQEKNSQIIEKDLQIGEGMQIFDNLYWNLYKEKYLVDFDDAYYIHKGGEIYTIVPAIGYDYKLYWGLLYALPKFEGLFIVDSSGVIEFLSPEEALGSEILSENRIFPENLARLYIEAFAFKGGLINYLFIHEEQTEIQDIGNNPQPFLLDTEEGLKWFVSTEPYGESHGIFKIFLIDGRTGRIELLELPGKTLTGPAKATDFVRKSNPVVDWTRFGLAEPLPFFRNNTLFWKVVVIPADSAGIAYQAFVDAETNDVTELDTNEEILAFVKGNRVIDGGEEPEDIVGEIEKRLAEIEGLLGRLKGE